MIYEITTVHIDDRYVDGFRTALPETRAMITSAEGHIDHDVESNLHDPCQFAFTIKWKNSESAIDRFRESGKMKEVRYLLHRYYDRQPRTCYYSESSLPTTTDQHETVGN